MIELWGVWWTSRSHAREWRPEQEKLPDIKFDKLVVKLIAGNGSHGFLQKRARSFREDTAEFYNHEVRNHSHEDTAVRVGVPGVTRASSTFPRLHEPVKCRPSRFGGIWWWYWNHWQKGPNPLSTWKWNSSVQPWNLLGQRWSTRWPRESLVDNWGSLSDSYGYYSRKSDIQTWPPYFLSLQSQESAREWDKSVQHDDWLSRHCISEHS